MTKVTSLLQRASDRLLEVFLPHTSAAAADCWNEKICSGDAWGRELYMRSCCRYASGAVRCDPYRYVCAPCPFPGCQ
jgi:hypothetical protein